MRNYVPLILQYSSNLQGLCIKAKGFAAGATPLLSRGCFFFSVPGGKIGGRKALLLKSAWRKLLQLDLHSDGMYGFYTSPTGKGFSRCIPGTWHLTALARTLSCKMVSWHDSAE